MPRWLTMSLKVLAALVVAFGLMQLVPYGRTHSNPPITQEPAWDSPRTRELAKRACFDCHSNETRWPWYADVAPFSWVLEYDVNNAREIINFSQWNYSYPLAQHSGASIRQREMPTAKYVAAHPEANLTDKERDDLANGLDRTLGRTQE